MTAREELFRRVAGAFVDEGRANELIDAYRAEVRAEAAADIRRAVLPSFPAGERAELVAQTMRAIDARIAEHGAEAPYGVAGKSLTLSAEVDRLRATVAEMESAVALLAALEAAGVGNWCGYDVALQAVT